MRARAVPPAGGVGSTAGSNPSRPSSPSSACRQLRDRVRRPASAPQTRPVSVASSASAPTRSASAASSPASRAWAGGSNPSPGAPALEEVEVLGPPDGAPVDRLDVDQADLAEPLEVQPHGVGVDARGARRGRWRRAAAVERGQLLVHRVAGLVAEGLQDASCALHRSFTT